MWKLREVLIFCAGAEFFHALSHLLLPLFVSLPMSTRIIELTPALNFWSIIINAILALGLLLWARKL